MFTIILQRHFSLYNLSFFLLISSLWSFLTGFQRELLYHSNVDVIDAPVRLWFSFYFWWTLFFKSFFISLSTDSSSANNISGMVFFFHHHYNNYLSQSLNCISNRIHEWSESDWSADTLNYYVDGPI